LSSEVGGLGRLCLSGYSFDNCLRYVSGSSRAALLVGLGVVQMSFATISHSMHKPKGYYLSQL